MRKNRKISLVFIGVRPPIFRFFVGKVIKRVWETLVENSIPQQLFHRCLLMNSNRIPTFFQTRKNRSRTEKNNKYTFGFKFIFSARFYQNAVIHKHLWITRHKRRLYKTKTPKTRHPPKKARAGENKKKSHMTLFNSTMWKTLSGCPDGQARPGSPGRQARIL